jgi:hypothetical protein
MKKFILSLSSVLILSGCPIFSIAQSSLERSAVDAGAALIGGLFKKKKSKPREETQEMSYVSSSGSDAYAGTQQSDRGAIKIVTGHPDLKVKVRRCAASGKILIIDLTFTNVGTSDVDEFLVYATRFSNNNTQTEAIDDEGNVYKDNMLVSSSGDPEYTDMSKRFSLIPDVPMKVSFRITGVSESAETIARLKIGIYCRALGFSEWNHYITIRNIPIARD